MADEIAGFPKLKVDDLKKELQKRGLKTKGTKSELQERLLEFLKIDVKSSTDVNEEQQVEITDIGIGEEDELESPTKKEAEDEEDNLIVKTDEPEAPKNDFSSKKKIVVMNPESTKPQHPVLKVGLKSPEEEKRILRGKRFGEVTNETDKKKLRAERFKSNGNSSEEVVIKGKVISGSELESLKKRAERFGVISPAIDKLSENERKTKRQERFGLVTSIATTPNQLNRDAAKKKRAERFGLG